jgi:hypothetical protein
MSPEPTRPFFPHFPHSLANAGNHLHLVVLPRKDHANVIRYLIQNTLQAYGFIPYRPRNPTGPNCSPRLLLESSFTRWEKR